MSGEPATIAALLVTAREALERYVEVHVDDDGALSFQHGDVPCAVQGIQLADGLAVLSLTCVVGWDLAGTTRFDPPAWVGTRAGEGLFGTLGATRTDRGWDITLRYVFPAAGLAAEPMGTLLMLVVSTASQVRAQLPAGS